MAYMRTGQRSLYYNIFGEGAPILLIHGAATASMGWWQQIAELSRSYKVITFDQSGFGQSPACPGSDWTTEAEALVDHLGIERLAVVGHSRGGFTAARFASSRPDAVAALVLSCTSAGMVSFGPPPAGAPIPTDYVTWATDFARLGFEGDHALQMLFRQIVELNQAVVLPDLLRDLVALRIAPEPIAASGMPMLGLVGGEDRIMGPLMHQLPSHVPQCQLVTVPGAGHAFYFDKADNYNQAVASFLAENYPPR